MVQPEEELVSWGECSYSSEHLPGRIMELQNESVTDQAHLWPALLSGAYLSHSIQN